MACENEESHRGCDRGEDATICSLRRQLEDEEGIRGGGHDRADRDATGDSNEKDPDRERDERRNGSDAEEDAETRRDPASAAKPKPRREHVAEDRGQATRERRDHRRRKGGRHRGKPVSDEGGEIALERVQNEDESAPARSKHTEGVRRADVPTSSRAQIDAPSPPDQESGRNPAE